MRRKSNQDTIEFGKKHSTKVQIWLAKKIVITSFLFISLPDELVIFPRYYLTTQVMPKNFYTSNFLVNAQKKYVKRILYKKSDICLEDEMTFQIGKKKCKLTQLVGVKRMNF